MATKTDRDVVEKALRHISIIAAGETADPDDFQDALDEYTGFHEWLKKEFPKQVYWNSDKVPEEYWTHIAGWFAQKLNGVFPVSDAIMQRVEMHSARSETALREMLSPRVKSSEAAYY